MIQRWIRKPELDHLDELFPSFITHVWLDTLTGEMLHIEDDKDSQARDPNKAVRYPDLYLIFTDQAEFYAVCPSCYMTHKDQQWSGHTHLHGWQLKSREYLDWRRKERPWCEFCDPIFGNGGWLT